MALHLHPKKQDEENAYKGESTAQKVMILGRIIGKVTTTEFTFKVEANPQKFDYVQVYHPDYDYVLCQIVEIERTNDTTIAKCVVIGYLDEAGRVRSMRTPFELQTEVLMADDSFIRSVVKLDDAKKGAYMGFLEGKKIPVYLKLNDLLTKHMAVLAKSGGGKSYTVGVLLEEIMEKKVPLLVIDPHGEYSTLAKASEDDPKKLAGFGIEPKGFEGSVEQYGDPDIVPDAHPLKLPECLGSQEILHLLPAKLSANQQNVLFSALKEYDKVDFDTLKEALELEENNAKYSVINIIDVLNGKGIFSKDPTPYHEFVQSGRCTILNLKGIEPEMQNVIVCKVLTDLFELRKKEKVPPFFSVIEEAHTFCPERSFGETKASKILRVIASEGRKFGLGLGVVTQRPARVDKSILSQCSTQIILKVTNPNDLKAISSSVEGLTPESEKEVMNLPIGTALLTGVVDVPLVTTIRPRKTKHGGEAVNMLQDSEDEDFLEQIQSYRDKELLPVIKPKLSLKDIELMEGRKIDSVTTILSPAMLLSCEGREGEFRLLADLHRGGIVYKDQVYRIPDLESLSRESMMILKTLFTKGPMSTDQLRNAGIDPFPFMEELTSARYVVERDGRYHINEGYVFTHLENRQTYSTVEYLNVGYDEMREAEYSDNAIHDDVKRYVSVRDAMQVYRLEYRVRFSEDSES